MRIDPAWLRQQFPDITSLTALNPGGQKSVYAGTHPADGEVVLKIFHPNTEPERALREVRAVQNIRSPRVPHVLDIGLAQSPLGNIIWLREERIAGVSLRDRLASGTLSPREVMRLGLHVLEALAAAEAVRIVHRDVKPENIIVATDGSYWLLDFGIARHLDQQSLTPAGLAFGLGTAGYAPPEQFRNVKPEIDARSDLFALGVTIYECVEGVNPFRQGARDVAEVLHRVETRPLPPISKRVDSAGQFSDIVLAMTRVQRNHRPATADDALQWMQEICNREGIR
jgi:eukaryotic-like serine/threonine-protein kinase